jgi:hypothetical protein
MSLQDICSFGRKMAISSVFPFNIDIATFRKNRRIGLAQKNRWKCLLVLFSPKGEGIIGFSCRSEKTRKESGGMICFC